MELLKMHLNWYGQIYAWWRRDDGNQHFLLFPQCFQKYFLSGSLKLGTEG